MAQDAQAGTRCATRCLAVSPLPPTTPNKVRRHGTPALLAASLFPLYPRPLRIGCAGRDACATRSLVVSPPPPTTPNRVRRQGRLRYSLPRVARELLGRIGHCARRQGRDFAG